MSWLLLLGCPKPSEVSPVVAGSHVVASTGLQADELMRLPERQRFLSVLDASAPKAQVCYERALQANPLLYGDLSVWLVLTPEGGVDSAEVLLSTMGDEGLESCVLEVLSGLQFPSPSRAGLTLRYPFVFTSELTPPEVTRALLLEHGLLDLEAEAAAAEQAAREGRRRGEQGHPGWTESW